MMSSRFNVNATTFRNEGDVAFKVQGLFAEFSFVHNAMPG